jgi:hypothetical protein
MNLIPKYVDIKISNASPGSQFTQQNVHKLQIRDELQCLYVKK